jgi:hypothetical protein
MATAADHQAKADHHLAFLQTIPDQFPDWLATVAFYAAVELVERLRAERGQHSRSHEDRKNAVRKDFPSIFKDYHDLYNASLDARYMSLSHCLDVKDVRDVLIGRRLQHIIKFAASHSKS